MFYAAAVYPRSNYCVGGYCGIGSNRPVAYGDRVFLSAYYRRFCSFNAGSNPRLPSDADAPVELTEEQKQEIVDYEALLTKSMTVEFVADTAQFKNPDEAYAIMDDFVAIANTLDGAIIQIEGNINASSYTESGQALSAERAKAVAKYLIACGIDANWLITVGNGNTKMVAEPGSADAYLNRRTDVFFKIIEE